MSIEWSIDAEELHPLSEEEIQTLLKLFLALQELQDISSSRRVQRKKIEMEEITSYTQAVEHALAHLGLEMEALKTTFQTIVAQTDAHVRHQELQQFYAHYGSSFEQAFEQAGIDRIALQSRLLARSELENPMQVVWQGLALGRNVPAAMYEKQ